jgi:hypothetical protein
VNWVKLCRGMLENHGLLPDQLLDVPLPQLMALSKDQDADPERAHLERLARKGVIREDEIEGHYAAMQAAKAEREEQADALRRKRRGP